MSVSGVGSRHTYIYNSQTGKLASKDGSKDEFVDYFNGDLAGEEADFLNGFDAARKRDLQSMIEFFSAEGAKSPLDGCNGDVYEISSENIDATTSTYSVNGKKVFMAYDVCFFSYVNHDLLNKRQPYRTQQSRGYNPADNSINIAVGDVINLGNGYRLKVKEDCVQGEGYGRKNGAEDQKMKQLEWSLSALIHFADQQWFAAMIDRESTPMLLALLGELGVDTNKEFIINGTRCEVQNGRISEVGNKFAIPSTMQGEAIKRYEELLYRPLSEKK